MESPGLVLKKNQKGIDQPQTKPKKANDVDVITRNDL